MKKILIFAAVMLLTLASGSFAQEQGRADLAKEFSEVLGLQALLDSSKAQTNNSADRQIDQLMQQLKRDLVGAPNEVFAEIDTAAKEYMAKVKNAWSAQEAAKIYTNALSDLLPPDDLRKAIEHYRTPEGQKELKAINEAASRLGAYITTTTEKESALGIQEFLAKLRAIMERAKQ